MASEELTLTITLEDLQQYKRLDLYLVEKLDNISRNLIKQMFSEGQFVANLELHLKKMPPVGTIITVVINQPTASHILPENIPLDILYEDEHLIIVNKPAGMVTHPGAGVHSGTLVNAILFHCPDLKGIGNVLRPGIVHRLDKGTSGVMVVAKTQLSHTRLVDIFSIHQIKRQYQAIVQGEIIQKKGKLESIIGRNPQNRLKMKANVVNGKKAITYFEKIKSKNYASHLHLTLETGRTHQIRVHLSQLLGHAILCDQDYANPNQQLKNLPISLMEILKGYPYPLLHAKHLGFTHPITNQVLDFHVDPPEIFKLALAELDK